MGHRQIAVPNVYSARSVAKRNPALIKNVKTHAWAFVVKIRAVKLSTTILYAVVQLAITVIRSFDV